MSFRFLAVKKGHAMEQVPSREKTGIQFLKRWMLDCP